MTIIFDQNSICPGIKDILQEELLHFLLCSLRHFHQRLTLLLLQNGFFLLSGVRFFLMLISKAKDSDIFTVRFFYFFYSVL
jgi:hypothetical protein